MDNTVTVLVLTVLLAGVHGQTIFDLLKPQPNGAQVMTLLKNGGMKNAPKLIAIPENATYDCRAEQQAGYYADENFGCQVFYRCERDGKMSKYLCSPPAVFNQITLVCDYWYNVDCQKWVSLRNFANSRLYLDTTEQLFDNAPDDYQLPNFGNPAFPNINLPYVNRTKKPWLIKPVVTAPPRPNKPYTFDFTKTPYKPPVYTDGRTRPAATRRPTTTSYFEQSDTTEPSEVFEPETTEPTKGTRPRTKRPDGEGGITDMMVTSGPLDVVSSTTGDYDQVDAPSVLSCGTSGHVLSSASGIQQGDPLGPLLYCLAAKSFSSNLTSELHVFYLDDGALAGKYILVGRLAGYRKQMREHGRWFHNSRQTELNMRTKCTGGATLQVSHDVTCQPSDRGETTKPTLQPRQGDDTATPTVQRGVTPPAIPDSTELLPEAVTDAPVVPSPTRLSVTASKGTKRPRTPKMDKRPLGKGGKFTTSTETTYLGPERLR